jgi:hypothetical protein
MATDPRLLTTDARSTANRLLDALQRERIADVAAATEPSDLGLFEIDAHTALIEQAKGALMLHYGIDSHQAFAVLVGWAQTTRTPVRTIAHTLLRGICEGNPQTEVRQRPLMRWLEAQLRDGDPGHAQLPDGAGPSRTGT